MDKSICPGCGNNKKPWFELCWECSEEEKLVSRCEVCGVEVPDDHFLCRKHWAEETKQISRELPTNDFRDKYEGKYYFDSQKVKSKSELLICYFLAANGLKFRYEPMMTLSKEFRPDFVIEDSKGNAIILEHFGVQEDGYNEKRKKKEDEYKKFCAKNSNFFFVWTDENDIYNLKDRLGKKLNSTPLKKAIWK